MNVIDFLKEKSERLARNRDHLIENFNPQMREYLAEAVNQARQSQWFSWAWDPQAQEAANSERPHQVWALQNNDNAVATLNELSGRLHQETFVGDWHTIEQHTIDAFADATGDHQWIHTDPERARRESPYRETVAHGFLTLSMIPKLTGAVDESQSPFPLARMVINLGLNQVRYPYPVKAGNRIRATKTLVSVTPVKRGLEICEKVTVEIEGIRRPACVAETVMLLIF